MSFTLAQLQEALDKCVADGFTIFVSYYGQKVRVDLTKNAYGTTTNMNMSVKGEGDDVAQAFLNTFNNFPQRPLDGVSKWKDDRLAPPVEDADFTETPDAS